MLILRRKVLLEYWKSESLTSHCSCCCAKVTMLFPTYWSSPLGNTAVGPTTPLLSGFCIATETEAGKLQKLLMSRLKSSQADTIIMQYLYIRVFVAHSRWARSPVVDPGLTCTNACAESAVRSKGFYSKWIFQTERLICCNEPHQERLTWNSTLFQDEHNCRWKRNYK